MKSAKKRAFPDIRLGLLGASLGFEVFGEEKVYLPVAGGHYLLTNRNSTNEQLHDHFEVGDHTSPVVFVFDSRSEVVSLLVYPAPRTYVVYQTSAKKKCLKLPQVEEVEILQFSVNVGHWYPKHAAYICCGHHGLRYHTYLIYASYVLKDAVVFAYAADFYILKPATTGKENKNIITM